MSQSDIQTFKYRKDDNLRKNSDGADGDFIIDKY